MALRVSSREKLPSKYEKTTEQEKSWSAKLLNCTSLKEHSSWEGGTFSEKIKDFKTSSAKKEKQKKERMKRNQTIPKCNRLSLHLNAMEITRFIVIVAPLNV